MSQTDIIHNRKTNQDKIDPNKFYEWSKSYQYVSSYQSNSSDKPNELKSDVIQGYAGFMPQIKTNNMFGKTFARSARQVLSCNISSNPHKLSSTGLNSFRHNFADQSLNAFTHKFGGTTIQKNHPSIQSNLKESYYKDQFKQPIFSNQINPNFDDLHGGTKLSAKTNLSGFMKNNSMVGFRECLDTNLQLKDSSTEYQDKYEAKKDRVHRDVTMFHIRNKSLVFPA